MKRTVNPIASNLSKQVTKNQLLHFSFYSAITLLLILFFSCTKDNTAPEDPATILACKKKPAKITFGRDASVIKYNSNDKPVTITTTKLDPAAPSQPPVTTIYTIE